MNDYQFKLPIKRNISPSLDLEVGREMFIQIITIENKKWQISRPIYWRTSYVGWRRAKNHIFYCPQCGKVWGKLEIINLPPIPDLLMPVNWKTRAHPCQECWDSYFPPGSILAEDYNISWADPILIHYLPKELLDRELELHWKWRDTLLTLNDNNNINKE